jgi:hypothetical protein
MEEMERLQEWELQEKSKHWNKTSPSATNPTWTDVGQNAGRHSEKPRL